MLTPKEKIELAVKADIKGYQFSSVEAAAAFVGVEVPDYSDEVALMELGAKADAKLSVMMVEAIEQEVMSNV